MGFAIVAFVVTFTVTFVLFVVVFSALKLFGQDMSWTWILGMALVSSCIMAGAFGFLTKLADDDEKNAENVEKEGK